MLLQNIKKNGHYIITKGTSCKTLQKGDRVIIQCSGRLMLCGYIGGWLEYDEWKDLSAEVDVDVAYYKGEIRKAMDYMAKCKDMLGNT